MNNYENLWEYKGKTYDLSKYENDQVLEIQLAIADGIDIDGFMDWSINAKEMRQIRLKTTLDDYLNKHPNVNVVKYLNDNRYSFGQILEIAKGMNAGIDVKRYDNPDLTKMEMEMARDFIGEYPQLTISDFSKVSVAMMETIEYSIKAGFDIDKLLIDRPRIQAGVARMLAKFHKKGIKLTDEMNEHIDEYDEDQLKELFKAMKKNIDVSKFCNPKISSKVMEYLRENPHNEELIHYAFHDLDELEEIHKWLSCDMKGKYNRDIDRHLEAGFSVFELYMIRKGEERGLDVESYAKINIGEKKMEVMFNILSNLKEKGLVLSKTSLNHLTGLSDEFGVLHVGPLKILKRMTKLKKEKLEKRLKCLEEVLLKPYDSSQLMELMKAIMDGVDVSRYSDPNISADCMKLIRKTLSSSPHFFDDFDFSENFNFKELSQWILSNKNSMKYVDESKKYRRVIILNSKPI